MCMKISGDQQFLTILNPPCLAPTIIEQSKSLRSHFFPILEFGLKKAEPLDHVCMLSPSWTGEYLNPQQPTMCTTLSTGSTIHHPYWTGEYRNPQVPTVCTTNLQGAQYISLLNREVPELPDTYSVHYLSTGSTIHLPYWTGGVAEPPAMSSTGKPDWWFNRGAPRFCKCDYGTCVHVIAEADYCSIGIWFVHKLQNQWWRVKYTEYGQKPEVTVHI